MAKSPQLKNGKRRPPKKRSSFSPWLKSIKRATKTNLKRLRSFFPTKSKRSGAAPRKATATTRKARQRRLINLPLGPNIRLVLSLTIAPSGKSSKAKSSKNRRRLVTSAKKTRRKKLEIIFSGVLVLAGLYGMVFFGIQTIAAPPKQLAPSNITAPKAVVKTQTKKQVLPRSLPLTLRIPDIQLNSPLSTVGTQPDGSIEVPVDYTKAGWYRSSPTPGEMGPAVIVGHLDNIHGLAIFWRLRELVPGQIIEIDRQDGKTARFAVEQVNQFPQDSFPTDAVYGNIDHAGLRLITCGGTFNHFTQHYSDNTIVFASLVT